MMCLTYLLCGVMECPNTKKRKVVKMTQSNNKNPFDKSQAENNNNHTAQANHDTSINVLNLRWQEIRKWEINRLRVQELNHHLAFMRKSVKQSVKIKNFLKARNDPVY